MSKKEEKQESKEKGKNKEVENNKGLEETKEQVEDTFEEGTIDRKKEK
ncbi:DUF4025 domain-containing protein [Halalkalibacter nanhaiisediminis]|uniref:Uncharacterized protein DUF4025 n=1 Tax=Halalkalibacter nanhaiisediminis TaxID=688079 RepID=A0A562QR82_9BACI|nr:DUF4025 domain-containing protein [Halalkalibacter nanhaiisediminis]TWI59183.1 uncharacterized protein DUF4025 [Halalkalibacter nanhaiisediminis]